MSDRREIRIEGHTKSLFVQGVGESACGEIVGGVTFNFDGEGAWVMDRRDIHRLSRELKKQGKKRKEPR